jgi:flagellar L-ring protein precursor FlgH
MRQLLACCQRAGWPLAISVGLGGCAQVPREPLVQQPMTARPEAPMRVAAPVNGAIYQAGAGAPALFEDRRPRHVGDILTILVSENVNASKSSAANASRSGSASAELGLIPALFSGLISSAQDANASGKNTMSAKGGANAMNTFNGVITVTVVDLLPNGNLLVSGEKQMLINQGTEFIRFSGVVNPRLVSANNTVASSQVADVRIEYSAKGYIDEAQTMGWLQRMFLNVLPF